MRFRPSAPVSDQTRRRFVLAGVVSLVAWVVLRTVSPGGALPWTPQMVEAATDMEKAIADLARECEARGITVDPGIDPNGTCLVGPEVTELLTSLGQLEAKRTTTNPDMAGLLVHLLSEAGIGEGDRVAVGASGSFPGLLLATVTALEALGATPVSILSLGASSYGATRTDFHLADLHEWLEGEGFVSGPPAAVSLGGSGDVGGEFDEGFREGLLRELREEGREGVQPHPRLLQDPVLRSGVAERMAIYGAVAAFVNIGGGEANMGISPKILEVPPGLVSWPHQGVPNLPAEDQRGVLFEMASRGVPVIHLLHIRGLALRYGLSWDPLPLPVAGSTSLTDAHRGKGFWFWLLTVGYFGALALVFLWPAKRNAAA